MTKATDSFVISTKTTAAWLGLASFGLLATLAIVVGVKDVDILSTVALVLAILAFVVQLIVFVVQSTASTRQLADAHILHSQMMVILAEMQERSQGTQKSINLIEARFINDLEIKARGSSQSGRAEGALSSASEAVEQETISTEQVIGSRREVTPRPPSNSPSSDLAFPEPLPVSIAAAIQSELRTWPTDEEMPGIAKILEGLSDHEVQILVAIARDVKHFTSEGSTMGPGVPPYTAGSLLTHGLSEKIPGWKLETLTPLGRNVARVLIAPRASDAALPAAIEKIRKTVDERQAALDREMARSFRDDAPGE